MVGKAWATHEFYSDRVSGIVRQLAFAGIAIIWLFRNETDQGPVIGHDWALPALLVVLALTADAFHYIGSSYIWEWYANRLEKRAKEETVEGFDSRVNWWSAAFFFLKVVAVLAAYVVILTNLFGLIEW